MINKALNLIKDKLPVRLHRIRYVYRNSVTGEFVSKEYADANPDTTERERI